MPDAEGAGEVRPRSASPPWTAQLGRVRPTGCYAYGDVYGDQTSYLVTFAYEDSQDGGPEHAVVALVDHNIGITKDVFVGSPAERILGQVREMCAADELTWFREEDPGRLRGEVDRHLEVTDDLTELPAEGSLSTDRALAAARLALLPASTVPPLAEPPALRTDHEPGPRLPGLPRGGPLRPGARCTPTTSWPSLHFCLSLILDHAASLPDAGSAALEPGGGRAVPAGLGAPARGAGHGRRGDAAPGGPGLVGVRDPQARAAGRGRGSRPTPRSRR